MVRALKLPLYNCYPSGVKSPLKLGLSVDLYPINWLYRSPFCSSDWDQNNKKREQHNEINVYLNQRGFIKLKC